MLGEILGLAALLPAVGLMWVGRDGNLSRVRASWDPRAANPLLDHEDDDDIDEDEDEEDEDEEDKEWIEEEEELSEEDEEEEEEDEEEEE